MITGITSQASQCANPLIAYGNSTIAPIVLDADPTTGTKFIPNPSSTNSNNTRLLFLRATWASVSNRQLVYAGIGSTASCLPHIVPSTGTTVPGGWTIVNGSSTCFDAVSASYIWPESLYSPDCSQYFTISQTSTDQTISFDLITQFIETYTITRANIPYTFSKNITSKLPITLTFPLTVTVASSAVTVYSASSVQITAELVSQDVTNNPPYTVGFVTLLGRSFALDSPNATFSNGTNIPALIQVLYQSDNIIQTTRQENWNMYITPEPTACTLSGVYTINFNLYWTGVDSNGVALPSSQNPLPNNSTVQISFTLASQDFCATVFAQQLNATMRIYGQPPNPTTLYSGVSQKLGFFTLDTLYFQTQVTSDNLPILSVSLIHLWITWSSTNQTDLVINGTQYAQNILYTPSLETQPRDQNLFNIFLSENVFQVLQDSDTDFVFHAQLGVSYSTTGQKRKRSILNTKSILTSDAIKEMLSNNNNNNNNNDKDERQRRQNAKTGSASVTATSQMTLKATTVTTTTTPAPTNIITVKTSSSSTLIISFVSFITLLFFLL